MAIVGEAHIIVKAITTGIEREIREGFQGIEGAGTDAGEKLGKGYGKGFLRSFTNSRATNVFGKLRDAMASVENEAEMARQKFSQLVKMSHFVDAGLAALGGTVVALGGAIAGLGGALLGAAAAGGALLNSMISLKIGMGIAKLALGGIGAAVGRAVTGNLKYSQTLKKVREDLQQLKFDAEGAALGEKQAALNLEKAREALLRTQDMAPNSVVRRQAELDYQEAELAYRRAKDKSEDLKKTLSNPNLEKKMMTQASGGDPYAGLTKSQKEFAQYLVSIRGKLNDLKEAAASGFLPKLKTSIDILIKSSLPTLKVGFNQVGSAMGNAAIEFSKILGTKENQQALKEFFANVATNVKPLGKILGNFLTAFVKVLNNLQPLTDRFLGWIVDLSDRFKNFASANPKGMQDFFKLAGDSAAKVGKIFKNVFGGLFAIIEENLKPGSGGQMLLDWLIEATSGFANIGKNKGFSQFFKDSAAVTKEVFGFFGKIFGLFSDLGSDPNVLQFWKILNNEDNFKNINGFFDNAAAALPDVAELLVKIGQAVTVFSESEGVKVFFKVLKEGLSFLIDVFVTNDFARKAITTFGPWLAGASALFIVLRKFKVVGLVFLGAVNLVKRFLTGLGGLIKLIPGVGKFLDKFKNSKLGTWLDNMGKKFFGFGKAAKDGTKKVGDSVKETTQQLDKMVKASSRVEKAFKKMNSTIAATNRLLSTLRAKAGTSATAIGRLRDAAGTASTKISKVKSESKLAADKLQGLKRKADEAKKSLKELGKVKSNPNIGTGGGGGAGGGGGGTTVIPGGGKGGIIGTAIAVGASATIGALTPIADQRASIKSSMVQLEMLARANGGLGKAAKTTGKRLVELAYSQSLVTGISADQYIAVEKLLMKYPNLAKTSGKVGGAFDTLVRQSGSLAIVMGTDAVSAAQTMADAMRDPKTAIETLSAAGLVFTDTEKKKYDAILKTNGEVDAQGYLLDTVKTKYKGLDEKSATITSKIQTSWENLGKRLGEIFAPFFDTVGLEIVRLLERTIRLLGGEVKGYQRYVAPGKGKQPPPKTGSSTVGPAKNGGYIGFASGGRVSGLGTSRSDSIHAMLSNGEYVINARATAQNRQLLDLINSNKSVPQMGSNINIVVNPAPGMDEKALASLVSRRIAFEIRKGTI